MGLGWEWRHARKRGAGIFGDFWKKQFVESCLWARLVEIRTWASPVVGYGMRSAFVGSVSWDWTLGRPVQLGSWMKDDVGTVSIVKIVSFSPRVEKLKVKKWINVSYLNYRESSVFRVFPCIFWLCYIYMYIYVCVCVYFSFHRFLQCFEITHPIRIINIVVCKLHPHMSERMISHTRICFPKVY